MLARILEFGCGGAGSAGGARNFDDEFGATSLLGFDANARAMRLQYLIDDGEAEAGATDKSGLEGLEDARGLGRVNADTGVANLNAHPIIVCGDADGEHAARTAWRAERCCKGSRRLVSGRRDRRARAGYAL